MVTRSNILESIIKPRRGNLSAEHARYVLSLEFSPRQQARYAKLAAKAESGKLTRSEQAILDEFLAANAMLMVLQSKARVSLGKRHRAA